MESTRRLEIELPQELADQLRARVDSGEFASESAVVEEGLRRLAERERSIEEWLRTEAVEAYDDWKSGKVKGLSVDEVLASLEASRAERDQVRAAE